MILPQREKEKEFTDLVAGAKNIAIVADESAGVDVLASSLALRHLLRNQGKKVISVFSGPIPEEIRTLPDADKIQKDFGPKNLVIKIDYQDDPIEKISYSVEDEILNLIIHPRGRGFDVKKIRYFFEESEINFIIVFAASSLESLGPIYETAKKEFAATPIVNIDISDKNTNFGQLNIVENKADSFSQLLFEKLSEWKLKPTKEAARCLLMGIAAGRERSEAEAS